MLLIRRGYTLFDEIVNRPSAQRCIRFIISQDVEQDNESDVNWPTDSTLDRNCVPLPGKQFNHGIPSRSQVKMRTWPGSNALVLACLPGKLR